MKYNICIKGELQSMPANTPVRETAQKYSQQLFTQYIRRILSAAYKPFSEHTEFASTIPEVLQEILDYFSYEDISIDELAGYIIDEVDVDFDYTFSASDGYKIAEWIFEGFFRFQAGDYQLLEDAEDQCELLNIWAAQKIDIKFKTEKAQAVEAAENEEHEHQCGCNCGCHGDENSSETYEEEEQEEVNEQEQDQEVSDFDDGVYEM
ncbi:Conserved_hypothetical protein [Hexamita inflata]|uniref:Uncharacterized protein n=1 Tax=Hexamita inflata TaxID=28002 RepID=A0AA86USU0_9EUKA|nr:Conserved hypothetical protein [Hexamita inflata]